MTMTEYTVAGRWKTGNGWQQFERPVEAENESVAVERVYAEFGSRHGLKRAQVDIAEVAE